MEMGENEWRTKHLLFGLFIGTIVSYVFSFFAYTDNESAPMLIIFNFLFVSLIFPLNGSLKTKTSLLLMGNIIGFFWNNLSYLLAHAGVNYLGEAFNTLHIILNPLANLIWIVSFWSISLTILANSKKKKRETGL